MDDDQDDTLNENLIHQEESTQAEDNKRKT